MNQPVQLEDVMEYILRHRASNVGIAPIADLIERMLWLLADGDAVVGLARGARG